MLRYAFLASALALSTPALAQEMSPGQAAEQTAPATPAPETATPQDAAPTEPAAPTAQAQPAPRAPSVAEVVKAEFPAYDKDSTGDLSKAEFSQWLIALRTKAEPSAAADKAALAAWAGKAFAQADKDKSAAVNQTELTTFLSGAG